MQGGRRVVVTGMGIVSCLGNTLDDVSQSLKDCKSGITFNTKYEEIGMKSRVCGRPDIDADEFIDRKQTRFMGTNCKYAFIAMERAIADSGLSPEAIASPRVAGILGQGGTSISDIAETLDAVNAGKNRRIGPYRVTRSMGSTVSAVLSTAFKLQGVSYSISSACSTGAHCIGVGMEQIQLNKADIAFCGAGEAEDWGFSVMFDSMGALSTKYNDAPETASRAFDKTRDGFVIAGGGGIVVVEELEHAKARGAKIYAGAHAPQNRTPPDHQPTSTSTPLLCIARSPRLPTPPCLQRWSVTAPTPTGTTWSRLRARAVSAA